MFNLTLELQKRMEKLPEGERQNFEKYFAEQSAPVLAEIFRSFGRTAYNNAALLGPAGTGKSFLLNQIVSLFSFGHMPEYLKPLLGVGAPNERYKIVREAYLGKTDVVAVDVVLLSQDNTKAGKAFSTEEIRMRTILVGLFEAAKKEFEATGRRTIFVFDEVATLPELVQATLKKIMDGGGFVKSGYSVLAITTPNEFSAMVQDDSAIERRYRKIPLGEMSEGEAFKVVRKLADGEWQHIYGVNLSDDAIRFLVRMRKVLDSPPLAMPANVLKAANDLLLSGGGSSNFDDVLGLKEAQEFVMKSVGLTDVWFTGPNGEPPFHDFEARVNALVAGQEEVVKKIGDRLKAWARLGFGGDVPVFFLGGPSGSGKDTLVKAISQVMFGHESSHVMFSIGGAGGFAIESIIEGPPIGNHRDGDKPLLVKALEDRGIRTGIPVFNEAKDAPNDQLEKFKVFVESGEVRPKGKDSRPRPVHFPIFILGQYLEELFEGKTDAEVEKIYSQLTQDQIDEAFMKGKADGRNGAISQALLNRSKKSGGVFVLKPVPKSQYPKIVEISARKIVSNMKSYSNIDLTMTPALVSFIAEVAKRSGQGTRAMGATLIDFTETAVSSAMDLGLPQRDVAVSVDFEPGAKEMIVVRAGGKEYRLEANHLLRVKMCEDALTKPKLPSAAGE